MPSQSPCGQSPKIETSNVVWENVRLRESAIGAISRLCRHFGSRCAPRLEFCRSVRQGLVGARGHDEHLCGIAVTGIIPATLLAHRLPEDEMLGPTILQRQGQRQGWTVQASL